MNGDLAQLLTVATYGNAWLAQPDVDPPDLLTTNSTFQYVKEVRFDLREGRDLRGSWAGTAEWFRGLEERGTRQLILDTRNYKNPDHIQVAFAGPLTGSILADQGGAGEIWATRSTTDWDPATEYPPDKRIWTDVYEGDVQRHLQPPAPPSRDEAMNDLVAALETIRDFASDQGIEGWPEWFQEALDLANAERPEIPYHSDVLPPSTSDRDRQLAAAAFKAWVFGGMGSWNDKYLKGRRAAKKDRVLSDNLYRAILKALDAVAGPGP